MGNLTGRFGARYGGKVRQRFGEVEVEQRKKHKCPYCSNFKVRRVAMGIWECRKCNAKFTGKAYSPVKKTIVKEEELIEVEEK